MGQNKEDVLKLKMSYKKEKKLWNLAVKKCMPKKHFYFVGQKNYDIIFKKGIGIRTEEQSVKKQATLAALGDREWKWA